MNNKESKEMLAFKHVKEKFENDYNELHDSLYYYMLTYLEGKRMDNCLFKDEVENLVGVRKHEDILNYILNL